MEEHIVKILGSQYITHDVKRFTIEKPKGYSFKAGQATEVSINKPEWKEEKRPFTFTSLNDWKDLEFTIKIYREPNGVTAQLEKLQAGDELIIRDVWGTINYKDKKLKGNKLIFSNKTSADIILKNEFQKMLKNDFYIV